jgi:glutathione S-transferase
MSLILHFHPLSSFCHKVLMALYENKTPFEGHIVDFGDQASRAEFLKLWPIGKIPVLRDESRDRTIPETSIIIEYVERFFPGPVRLLPGDPDLNLEARLWDRFYDLYVNAPMQKLVADRLRPEGLNDPHGVAEAKATLMTSYAMIEQRMEHRRWAIGEQFSIADCAAATALFYAETVLPFFRSHERTAAYFDRLYERPSFRRTIEEAQPYFNLFPLREAIPVRFFPHSHQPDSRPIA